MQKSEEVVGISPASFLQSDAQALTDIAEDQMGSTDAQALMDVWDDQVGDALTGGPEFLRLACKEKKGKAKVDQDLGFVQSLKIDPTDDGCISLAAAVKFLSGLDGVFHED